ncbi:LytR C-terminal domain-containing protein [Agromyces sp. SYSU T00194]|uniref:LytR C-terminal domain-containing protein n=1 Tax=Agromyces chitinivorans TaxID=3158560 RepID=UPI003390E12A
MAEKYPRDRFDEIPDALHRVGAHRAPVRRRSAWAGFAWAAFATVVLAGFGIAAVMALDDRLFPEDVPLPVESTEAVATAEPTVDPSVPVTVLNGTSEAGLAASAAGIIAEAGFTVGTTANASENDIQTTVVYYASAELEGAARGVAQAIGTSEVRLSEEFAQTGADLVAVLGADHAETAAP